MDIRFAKEGDISAVALLEKQNFSVAWSENALRQEMNHSSAILLVAEHEKEIAGYCIFLLTPETADLCRIAVSDRYKRQGVGSLLLTKGIEECAGRGILQILLEVRESNTAAIHFYRKMSFLVKGKRRKYYTAPVEDAVIMCRDLPVISTIQNAPVFL